MKKRILNILLGLSLFAAVETAHASGMCIPIDRNDSYAKMTCPNRSSGGKTYCEYNDDCRWTEARAGSCDARNSSDSYARMVCPNRSSGGATYCEYNDDCVWVP